MTLLLPHTVKYTAISFSFAPFAFFGMACVNAAFTLNLAIAIAGVLSILAFSWAMAFGDRVFLGLHARYVGDGTIRVRGVHPDYLARLPRYVPADLRGEHDGRV